MPTDLAMAAAAAAPADVASATGAAASATAATGTGTTSGLGVALDAVTVGQQGVSWGFGIAKTATSMGFGAATAALRFTGEVGGPAAQVVTGGVEQVLNFAHGCTNLGQDLAHGITQASLSTAKFSLSAAGAQEGELLRLALGDEAAESIMMVLQMVKRFCTPLEGVSTAQLFLAARSWAAVQQAKRLELLQRGPPLVVSPLPPHAERAMRWSAATFGALFLAGMADGLSVAPAVRAYGGGSARSPAEMALAAAKVDGRVTVLDFEETSEHFVPGFMVAVDHELNCVVLALRGTSGAKDVLVDLVCEVVPCELAGVQGQAHGGMLRAAQRVSERLLRLVLQGLEMLEATSVRSPHLPDVLITGHSLGGGVAALLAALWRDQAALPPGRVMQCITFGCPQVLDAEHAMALANFTTSVILGDDLVPRLSLTTVQDLRESCLRVNDPEAFQLPSSLSTTSLQARAARGNEDDMAHLAAAHAQIAGACHGTSNRLFPAGRLVVLRQAEIPSQDPHYVALEGSQADVDEMLISSDMAAAHMPARYLKALDEAMNIPAPREVKLNGLG